MTDQIVFTPLLPLPWLPVLAAAALLVILPAMLRRARGVVLRFIGFGFLLGILAGPHWRVETRRPLPDIALLLVDHSASMEIGDRLKLAAAAAAALQKKTGVELRTVELPPAADGGTALFAALRAAMTTIPATQLAGIIAITDGEIADPPGAALPAPFTAMLTAKAPETDRELRLVDAPAYGLVGQTVTLNLAVLDHGAQDTGATAAVTITEDGSAIVTRNITIGQPTAIQIPVHHAGPAIIEAAVAPLPGEVSRINNQAAFTLNGIHKRLNVLLISGSPDPGERTWRVLLKSDAAIQLVHFTILRTPGETIDADPHDLALVPFPVHQLFDTDIRKFDLIILDRFNTAGLLPPEYLANIAAYVQNGGALLAELGPEFSTGDSLAFTPLGPILPAQPTAPGDVPQRFTPTVTGLGERHPVTAPFAGQTLAPWYRMEMATPNTGDVLMTGAGNAPLLILSAAGQGRVGLLLSDQLWLWTRGAGHDGPALPLLRRIVHFLLREPALEPEALNARIEGQKLLIDRQTLGTQYPGDTTVTAPGGGTATIRLLPAAPGHFTAIADAEQSGVWKVSEGDKTAYAATAVANAAEYEDLAATDSIVRPVAQRIIWLGRDAAPPLAELLRPRHATDVTGVRDIPLLPPLPVTLLAILLTAAAWWRESR